MARRPLKDSDREVVRKLKAQLSRYFARDRGSRFRALKSIGVDQSYIDKAFQRGNIEVAFLSQVLDELGLTFEDLVWDAFDFDSYGKKRGSPKPKGDGATGVAASAAPPDPSELEQRTNLDPSDPDYVRPPGGDHREVIRKVEKRLRELREAEEDGSSQQS